MTTPMTTNLLPTGDTVLGTFAKVPMFTIPASYPTKAMALTASKRLPGSTVLKVSGTFYVRLPVPVTRMH